ncbi:MAG: TolC family protein [Saprospiraceae bacterium]|nr:TolC family protein [Saprospiraceae bacterium]
MHKILIIIAIIALLPAIARLQPMPLPAILDEIALRHPMPAMYDAAIRSQDAAAAGARSWMAPELSAGFLMTPYNPNRWKAESIHGEGMGSFMISAQQFIPNRKKQDAQAAYMSAMSGVDRENKKATLNRLWAAAKRNYSEWIVLRKKQRVLGDSEQLLQFMVESAELRYRNGLEKINAYYKAKAALSQLASELLMLESNIAQKRIALNALMNRPPNAPLDIDTIFIQKDYSSWVFDSTLLAGNRSDIRAVDREMLVNQLKITAEQRQLLPEFGVRYDHMFAFGAQPWQFTLMGMVRLPLAPWSSGMYKANVESLKWRNLALQQEKLTRLNEASSMAYAMQSEWAFAKRQLELTERQILPALRRNLQTQQLAYEQNTTELFMLFDAWEALNETQMNYYDQLLNLLLLQTQLEEVLEIR